MAASTLILLSTDERLLQVVQGRLPEAEIRAVSCLRDLPLPSSREWLVIDPRSAGACCIERLSGWQHRLSPRRTLLLSLPARPEVLLILPRVVPGAVVRIDQIPLVVVSGPPASRAPLAWQRRQGILSPEGRPGKAREFLVLAREHSRDRYTVSEAATDLDMHVRRLTRLSLEWFDYPPGVVIGLARIDSLAAEVTLGPAPLRVIAEAYGYRDQSAMIREFSRFAGIPPGRYRDAHPPRSPSEIANPPSENAG